MDTRSQVSVVIPTYNRANVLPRALDSVISQTWEDFEVLVVDDGSTDHTAEVMAQYMERDDRVTYLVQPENLGVSAARNRGIREASGAFIAFLDSDDEWLPDKLELQVTQMRESPDVVGLSYTGVESVFDDGTTEVHMPQHSGDVYHRMLLGNILHGTSGVLARRNVFCEGRVFCETIGGSEDYELWLRIAKEYHFVFVERALLRYYDSKDPTRLTHNVAKKVASRRYIYELHGNSMREAKSAYSYLMGTIGWHLKCQRPDHKAILRLCTQAIRVKPVSRAAYVQLLRSVVYTVRRYFSAKSTRA